MNNKLPNASKIARVDELKKLFAESKSVAVVDYTGLNVSQATELRKTVRKAGGEMKVEKNTLFKIASGISDMDLGGLSAFIFAKTDEIAPLKVIVDFIKKNSLLSFKAGVYQNKFLSASQIESLAKTPSLETSIAKIMYLLQFNTSKLVRTLDAVSKSKGGDTN
jgi:large subunit ribosomal protein L10